MNIPNQGACQSLKTAKKYWRTSQLGDFADQQLAEFAKPQVGNIHYPRRVVRREIQQELMKMIGKLFGAWLGSKVAGDREGAKGAMLGYGAAALAKRSVPTLAAVALGGWAFKKWRERRRSEPAYPSEASPS